MKHISTYIKTTICFCLLCAASINASAQVVDNGTCGDNLTWTLTGSDENLTLTIRLKYFFCKKFLLDCSWKNDFFQLCLHFNFFQVLK